MKTLLSLAALALALSGCSGGYFLDGRTTYTGRPTSELAPVDPARVQAIVDDAAADEDAHYLRHETSREHVFRLRERGEWTYLEDVRGQYVVLDPESERMTTFRMTLPRRAVLEDAFFRVTSPSGAVETFTAADLIQERDGDDVVYKMAYRAVERGAVIEEAFRTRQEWSRDYQPPLYHDIALQMGTPADTLITRYVFPTTWGMRIKQTESGAVPLMEVDTLPDGRRVITVATADNAAFPDEPYAPAYKEVAPYLEFAVTRIESGPGLPPIYKAAESWEDLGQEVKDYAFRRGGLFSDPVRRKLGEIVDPAATDSAKVAQITTWVQKNIEVGGDSRDLGGVLRSGSGNYMLITGLTQALLDEAGVETSFLLIHPSEEGYFDRNFIHTSQFPVPAVLARVPGRDYILFPFIEGLPFSYIPEEFQGAPAMRVNADGFDGFVTLPTPEAQTYAADVRYMITIDEDGLVTVDETATLRGFAAFAMRSRFEDLTADEREKEARELLTYTETEVDAFTYELIDEDDPNAPLGVHLTYTIDDLVTVTPEEVIFQTGGLLSPASLKALSVDVRERQLPIRVYHDELTSKRLSITFPESWALTTELESVNERNAFGQAFASYTVQPGEILGMQRVRLNEAAAMPSAYGQFLEITGTASKLYVPTLVFSTVEAQASNE